MRLWHKDLIPVLPKQQLIAQYRECCCIARNIAVNGTPNHLLVNKVLDYPPEHFVHYTGMVHEELIKRGYKCDWNKFEQWMHCFPDGRCKHFTNAIFDGWHNDRYLIQCYYNLQEKHDCGGIPEDEWWKIPTLMKERNLFDG